MLEDFPIHGPVGAPDAASGARDQAPPSSEVSRHEVAVAVAESRRAAPRRAFAAAADGAAVLLLTALAILAARLRTGASPGPSGLLWIGGVRALPLGLRDDRSDRGVRTDHRHGSGGPSARPETGHRESRRPPRSGAGSEPSRPRRRAACCSSGRRGTPRRPRRRTGSPGCALIGD